MAEIKLDVEKLVNDTFGKHFGVTFDRLRELAEADNDGRLVVLPCKVGQTIYKANKASRKVNPWVVNAIYFSSKTELIIEAGRGAKHFTIGMFGKTVFLTREAAEAALEAHHA